MLRLSINIIFIALLAAGCASQVPQPIREAPETAAPTVNEVRGEPHRFEGSRIRWGGTIASVKNRRDSTWVEVVARPLGAEGRPRESDRSLGRFLAVFDGFLEPTVYSDGRQLTVYGSVTGVSEGSIGEYPYTYPRVRVLEHQLWQPEPEYQRVYDPWFWDPWYPYYWPHHRYRYW